MARRGVSGRLLATLLLCTLTGAAVVLHQRPGTATTTPEPGAGHIMPRVIPAAVSTAAPLPRTGWTVAADSAAGATPATNVLDGNAATTWRTANTALPHTLTIDTHNAVAISGLTYLPPVDSANGRIGRYRITTSNDGTTWSTPNATGTFADDAVLKTATFTAVITRYVRLTAVTEAGNRGNWAAAAEIELLGGTDPALSRTGWTVTADSQETDGENGLAANVLDGNTATIWHSAWSPDPVPPLPHQLVVDMHVTNLVSGLSYLPRQDGVGNGTIGQYRIETSSNGTDWGPPTAGAFSDVVTAQTVTIGSALARFVRLTALTEAGNRGPWSSAAEINVLGRANPTLSRTGWTVTADSAESTGESTPASNVLDGNATTFWHSRWSSDPPAPLPHTLTLDLKSAVPVGGLSYLPRPATESNGRIGRYTIESSTNGATWTSRVVSATFPDSAALQTVVFPAASARYWRLTAQTEAGNRGPWSSAAEINLLGPTGSVVSQRGSWGAPIGFPLVPVAAAQLPNGKILTWSSYAVDTFSDSPGGMTVTATYDPATGAVTQRTVTATGHDMFCPGISALADGRIMVTGGNDSDKTSIYNPVTDAWTGGPDMITPRGYHASATLSDGRVFTIGGSWSGGVGDVDTPHKAGEVWSAADGWTALPGASVVPMLTADANPDGDYRKDNHAWLFTWTGGKVLQAGPSRAMNWYTTSGTGGVTAAGTRGDDGDAMNGNAVMYDAGKILTIGGAPSYEQDDATANAFVLTVSGSTVTTRKVASMANTRAFSNSVVLPDGKVAVFGGQNFPVPFSDNTAVLSAEIWDPVTEQFSTMAPAAVPRTYHSVALLMPDGRVFTGGGGLCGPGCPTNHLDAEVFTPPYLLTSEGTAASRPIITTAPSTAANGATITVATNRAVTAFSIIRMGTATHSVDTDQRRIALTPTTVTGGYRLSIPADKGIAVPGYWMLFAMDSTGVPSVAKVIRVG